MDFGPLATAPTSLRYLRLRLVGATSVVFPNLVDTEELWLTTNQELTTISFPALRHVVRGEVEYCPKLSECAVDSIHAQLETGGIDSRGLLPCTQ